MKTVVSRRTFIGRQLVGGVGLAAHFVPRALAATQRLPAAVIGHTGRGDYGHGLDGIFAARPDVELVALADPDPAGRARAAARIGTTNAYADFQEMLDRHRPRLVSLAMRHADQHHRIALAALRSGAHLYCEKPFTTTPLESDEILAEAKMRGLKVAVAHTMRMGPEITGLKTAVSEGLLGELVEMRAYGKQDARAGGEDMMVLGTHLFDLMRLFAGDPVSCSAEVLTRGRNITKNDARVVKDAVGWVAGDQISARFQFKEGISATFTSAARLRDTTGHWGLELHGSRGVAKINCDLEPRVFVRQPSTWTPQGRTDAWIPLPRRSLQPTTDHNAAPVTDWLNAIATNREPECSGLNGSWAVEMVTGVYQSSLRGARTQFPLQERGHPLG